MLAIFLKSDLEVPQPLPKLFSLYLVLAIGFKGGYELDESGINPQIALTLIAAVVMACIVLSYSLFVLRVKLDAFNADDGSGSKPKFICFNGTCFDFPV